MTVNPAFRAVCFVNHDGQPFLPVEHPGSAAKAALNDCPHDRKAKGAHLAAFVSCIPLFDGACENVRLRLAGLRDAQVFADVRRCWADDLIVAWNRRCLTVRRIPIDGVTPALTKQLAAMLSKVAEEVHPLHATGTAKSSLRTVWPSASRRANSRFAWRIS